MKGVTGPGISAVSCVPCGALAACKDEDGGDNKQED